MKSISENTIDKKIYIIDIIKAAATVMIFCYHCNSLLPGEWKFITIFGDSLGNDLFFMISGFALFPSIMKTKSQDFPLWYGRRLKRIMPLLLLFYLLSYLTGFYTLEVKNLFTIFIYPSLYWFVTGILIFYILAFLFLKILPFIAIPLISGICFILWITRPGTMEAYYFLGFSAMLIGMIIRKLLSEISSSDEGAALLVSTAELITGIILFLYINIRLNEGILTDPVIRTFFGISVILTGAGGIVLGYLNNDVLKSFFAANPLSYRVAAFTGNLALPLYMVQCFNAGMIGYTIGQRIVFPLSFALNLIIVVGAASLLEILRTSKLFRFKA